MADEGYGEFSGGGSVNWKVKHGDGESGSANKDGGNGKDKDPKKGPGVFRVSVNGAVISTTPCDGTTVRIEWSES